eukprot:5881662-Amphidinium_carterae.1
MVATTSFVRCYLYLLSEHVLQTYQTVKADLESSMSKQHKPRPFRIHAPPKYRLVNTTVKGVSKRRSSKRDTVHF